MMKKRQSKNYGIVVFEIAFLLFLCIGAKKVQAGDYSSAEILPLNGAWSSEYWLTDEDHEQWYKIVVPSDGKLTYKVMGYCSVNYELYDEVCSRRFHSGHTEGSASSPDTNTIKEVLSGGTYYLKVTSYYGSRGKYRLHASFFPYHTNDSGAISYDSPQVITLGSVITGALTPTDTEDWYQISIPRNGYYHVKITSFCAISCQLYNYDLSNTIANRYMGSWDASESSPGTDEFDVVLSSGIHYLKAHEYYGSCGRYTFKISPLSQSACSHDYKKSYIDASYTSKGYTLHRCSKCGHAYKDDYQSKRTLGTPYLYSLYAGKKKATVSWSFVSNASGYQISYQTGRKTKQIRVGKKTRKTLKKLKSKKKCVVRVRAYRKEGAKTAYSKWSSKKSVKVR